MWGDSLEALGLIGSDPQELGQHKIHGRESDGANQTHEVCEEGQHGR